MPANLFITSSQFDVLCLQGADTARFLQGQLTCDLNTLSEPGCIYGAALNTKGRVITPFLLLKQDDRVLLVFNKGLRALFRAHLEKFLPFYKCQMHDIDNKDFFIIADQATLTKLLPDMPANLAFGNGAQLVTGGLFNIGNLQLSAYLFIAVPGSSEAPVMAIPEQTGKQEWLVANARAGHFPFSVEDSGLYTPQELNLDQHTYISFEKGCYTGQEIVARMHYRSKPKKRLYRIELHTNDQSETVIAVGVQVLFISGQQQFPLIKILPAGINRWCGLAQLPVEPEPDIAAYQLDGAVITEIALL